MPKFYLAYDATSLVNSLDLMDVDNYFVNAHEFTAQRNSNEVVLDLKITVVAKTTDSLEYKMKVFKDMVASAADAGPPNNCGPTLLLRAKFGEERLWTTFTVKRGVVVPMDLGVADANVYTLHARLWVLPLTVGDRILLSPFLTDGGQSFYVVNLRGTAPSATKFTLSDPSASLRKVWVAARGHRTLAPGDYDPHYPVTASASLGGQWQKLTDITSHGGRFDQGVFDVVLEVADHTSIIPPVRDLLAKTGAGGLPGGFYEYAQSAIVGGLEGPASNGASADLGLDTQILAGGVPADILEAVAFGGRLGATFSFGIDRPAMPIVGEDRYDFNVQSDGWVMQETTFQELLLPDSAYQAYTAPSNKRPPKTGELGFTTSLVRVSLPSCLGKHRTVALTLDIDQLQLGGLFTPVFFPIFGGFGVLADIFGWQLYYSAAGTPVDDWTKTALQSTTIVQYYPRVGHNTLSLDVDWRLGFTRAELTVNGNKAAALFTKEAPQDTDVLLGCYVSNGLPEPSHVLMPDPDPSHWSFTKVQIGSVEDSSTSGTSSSTSKQNGTSSSTSNSTQTSKGNTDDSGGSATNSMSGSGSSSKSSGGSTSNAFGTTDGSNSATHVSTLQFHYKNIPVDHTGASHFVGTPQDEEVIGTFGTLNPEVVLQVINPGLTKDIQAGLDAINAWFATPISYIKVTDPDVVEFRDYDTPVFTSGASVSASGNGGSNLSFSVNDAGTKSGGGSTSSTDGGGGSASSGTTSSTETSSSDSSSNSSSTSKSDSTNTSSSHSESINAGYVFDVPLAGKTRKVTWVGQVIQTSLTKASQSSSTASTQAASSHESSSSTTDSTSSSTQSSGGTTNTRSESKASSDSKATSGNSNDSNSGSTSAAHENAEETDIPGDIPTFTEQTVSTTDDPVITDKKIDEPAPGREVLATTALGDSEAFAKALGITEIDPVSGPQDGPLLVGIHNVLHDQPDPGSDFLGEIPIARTSEIDGPIVVLGVTGGDVIETAGLLVSPPHGPNTTTATQEADTLAQSSAKSHGSADNHSESTSGTDSTSQSSSFQSNSGSSSTTSHGESTSSGGSTSNGDSSSASGSKSSGLSTSTSDVFLVVPLLATVIPAWSGGLGIASAQFTESGVVVYDGALPSQGFNVSLAWTPEVHAQLERVYRRATSVVGGHWQYKEVNAGLGVFIDSGESGWTDGNPPNNAALGQPSLLRLKLDGIIDTRAVRTKRGYADHEYVVFPGITLPPSPDNTTWSFDIEAFGHAGLDVTDCFLMPQDQTHGSAEGTTASWQFETTRYNQSGGDFNLDIQGDFRLSPGGNVVTLLGTDGQGTPLGLVGTTVVVEVTPETDWKQALS